jgi:hypothetical protein
MRALNAKRLNQASLAVGMHSSSRNSCQPHEKPHHYGCRGEKNSHDGCRFSGLGDVGVTRCHDVRSEPCLLRARPHSDDNSVACHKNSFLLIWVMMTAKRIWREQRREGNRKFGYQRKVP